MRIAAGRIRAYQRAGADGGFRAGTWALEQAVSLVLPDQTAAQVVPYR